MPEISLFYPTLTRIGGYPVKSDGTHYVYTHYRLHIANDCERRCVYCDLHESEMGGPEMMQLDHFRPKSRKEYAHLCNHPLNLHYACGRCNLLKSDHWPATGPDDCCVGSVGFVDPFADNRWLYFDIQEDGRIVALRPPAAYLIDLLQLAREHLRKLREKRLLKFKLKNRIKIDKERLLAEIEAGRGISADRLSEIFSVYDRLVTSISDY